MHVSIFFVITSVSCEDGSSCPTYFCLVHSGSLQHLTQEYVSANHLRGRNVSCFRPLTASYWLGLAGMNTFASVVKSSGFLLSVGLDSRSFMQNSLALLEIYGWSSDRSLCAPVGDEGCWYVCLRHVGIDGVCTSSPSGPWSPAPSEGASMRDQFQKEMNFPLRRLWLLFWQISTSCWFLKREILQDFLSAFSSSAPAQQLEVKYFKLLYQCDQRWV